MAEPGWSRHPERTSWAWRIKAPRDGQWFLPHGSFSFAIFLLSLRENMRLLFLYLVKRGNYRKTYEIFSRSILLSRNSKLSRCFQACRSVFRCSFIGISHWFKKNNFETNLTFDFPYLWVWPRIRLRLGSISVDFSRNSCFSYALGLSRWVFGPETYFFTRNWIWCSKQFRLMKNAE